MLKLILSFSLLMSLAHAQKDFTAQEAELLKKEAILAWEKRDDQQKMEEALSKFEKVHETNPNDLEILTYLIRGYFLLGELHYTNDDLKMRAFEKARTFGNHALLLEPEFKKHASDDIEKVISKVGEKYVPALYWSAASLGKWAKLNGIMASLKYKGQILAMIERVEKLKPDYYYAAVPRYWGGYYAVAPGIAGGDMDKSKKKFHQAMEQAPELLTNKVLYAELYLVKKDDEKEFKKVLQEVLNAPTGPEEIGPENRMEKKKAERLLEKKDELF